MSDQSLRDALEQLAGEMDYDSSDGGKRIRALLAAHPAEPAPDRQPSNAAVLAAAKAVSLDWQKYVASMRVALEAAYRVDAPRPEVGVVHVQHADAEEYARIFNLGFAAAVEQYADAPRPLLDEIAVRNKIAEWYGAEWDAKDCKFYETDDGGRTFDEDEGAMDALRGFQWSLELVRPMPNERALGDWLTEHEEAWRFQEGAERRTRQCACGWAPDSWDSEDEFYEYYREHRNSVVLSLLNGTES